jgi:hypothetical protein
MGLKQEYDSVVEKHRCGCGNGLTWQDLWVEKSGQFQTVYGSGRRSRSRMRIL